jgi:hypothetical protein
VVQGVSPEFKLHCRKKKKKVTFKMKKKTLSHETGDNFSNAFYCWDLEVIPLPPSSYYVLSSLYVPGSPFT